MFFNNVPSTFKVIDSNRAAGHSVSGLGNRLHPHKRPNGPMVQSITTCQAKPKRDLVALSLCYLCRYTCLLIHLSLACILSSFVPRAFAPIPSHSDHDTAAFLQAAASRAPTFKDTSLPLHIHLLGQISPLRSSPGAYASLSKPAWFDFCRNALLWDSPYLRYDATCMPQIIKQIRTWLAASSRIFQSFAAVYNYACVLLTFPPHLHFVSFSLTASIALRNLESVATKGPSIITGLIHSHG
jgi:hypothetical protein